MIWCDIEWNPLNWVFIPEFFNGKYFGSFTFLFLHLEWQKR